MGRRGSNDCTHRRCETTSDLKGKHGKAGNEALHEFSLRFPQLGIDFELPWGGEEAMTAPIDVARPLPISRASTARPAMRRFMNSPFDFPNSASILNYHGAERKQ